MFQIATPADFSRYTPGIGTPTAKKLLSQKKSLKSILKIDNIDFELRYRTYSLTKSKELGVDTTAEKEYFSKLGFSTVIAKKAAYYMDLIVDNLQTIGYANIAKPGISMFEDGLLLEWVIPHARMGLFFDPESGDASYYAFTDNPREGISASGPINKITEELLVDTFLRQVEFLKEMA